MAYACCMLDKQDYTCTRTHGRTNTQENYVILIAFLRQRRFRELASILRYTCIGCFVHLNTDKQFRSIAYVVQEWEMICIYFLFNLSLDCIYYVTTQLQPLALPVVQKSPRYRRVNPRYGMREMTERKLNVTAYKKRTDFLSLTCFCVQKLCTFSDVTSV